MQGGPGTLGGWKPDLTSSWSNAEEVSRMAATEGRTTSSWEGEASDWGADRDGEGGQRELTMRMRPILEECPGPGSCQEPASLPRGWTPLSCLQRQSCWTTQVAV